MKCILLLEMLTIEIHSGMRSAFIVFIALDATNKKSECQIYLLGVSVTIFNPEHCYSKHSNNNATQPFFLYLITCTIQHFQGFSFCINLVSSCTKWVKNTWINMWYTTKEYKFTCRFTPRGISSSLLKVCKMLFWRHYCVPNETLFVVLIKINKCKQAFSPKKIKVRTDNISRATYTELWVALFPTKGKEFCVLHASIYHRSTKSCSQKKFIP